MKTKNKIQFRKILFWLIPLLFIFPTMDIFAATPVSTIVLQPNDLLSSSTFQQLNVNTTNLGSLLGTVFNLGIAIAVVLALIMIILGGIEMMTSDSWTKHDDGRKKIDDALLGLGLALISWLLLYIINPSLVLFNGNLLLNPTQNSQQTTTSPAPSTATGPFPNQ